MDYDVLLVRYGELALKSSYVRQMFESTLVNNIHHAHRKDHISHQIRKERGRLFLSTSDFPKSSSILSHIFGIVSYSPAVHTDATIQDISFCAVQLMKNRLTKETSFAIRPTRTGSHHFTSQEVAVQVGDEIVQVTHAKVDLSHPDVELFIEVRGQNAFLFTEKKYGVGGLPLGTQGRVLCVIEKPCSLLAAWYLMRRGCNIDIANTKESNEPFIRSFLTMWYTDAEILFIDHTSSSFNTQLARLASEKQCDALVTDHSLETISSSLTEIAHLKKECSMPILTPLVSLSDKGIEEQCRTRGIST
jgi:thiamine biosynthesis protein ThiI